VTAESFTSRELIQSLLADGHTKAEIARAVGRSERYIRFVANGQKPGDLLAAPLTEMATTGTVTKPAERRVNLSTGRLAKIRGKEGTVIPPTPKGQRPLKERTPPSGKTIKIPPRPGGAVSRTKDQPPPLPGTPREGRHRYEHPEPHRFPNGGELHTVRVPRRASGGRTAGADRLAEVLGGAQEAGRRVDMHITVETGPPGNRKLHQVRLGGKGGYDPAQVLAAVKKRAEKRGAGTATAMFGWLMSQAEGRDYDFIDDKGGQPTIVEVQTSVW